MSQRCKLIEFCNARISKEFYEKYCKDPEGWKKCSNAKVITKKPVEWLRKK